MQSKSMHLSEALLCFIVATKGNLGNWAIHSRIFRHVEYLSDEFLDYGFATCSTSVDGSFEVSVELREPYPLDLPKGSVIYSIAIYRNTCLKAIDRTKISEIVDKE